MNSASDAAALVRAALEDEDREVVLDHIVELHRVLSEADVDEVDAMVESEPPLTHHLPFDAAVAALAERHAMRVGLPAPKWTRRPERFIPKYDQPLMSVADLEQVHVTLRLHGVLIRDADLDWPSMRKRLKK